MVGLSGGVDSLALAAVLGQLDQRGVVEATAVHVDHGLREGSAAEQRVVAGYAATLGLRFHGVTLTDDLTALHPGLGWEEAARRARFHALATIAAEEGATIIALGHHASDQAETVLLHIARGSGLRGAGGMRDWGERAIPWWTGAAAPPRFWIWRPFLAEQKATLQAFVEGLGLTPIDDPTNRSAQFTRNRIRNEIMPELERIVPGATAALGRFANLAAAEDDFLDLLAVDALSRAAIQDGSLDARTLSTEHRVIGRRVVRSWVFDRIGIGVDLGLDRVDAVLRLADASIGGTSIEIGSGWSVTLQGGRLWCSTEPGASDRRS